MTQDLRLFQDIILFSKHDDLPFCLDARFVGNQNTARPTIIFIHGFNGFKDWGHFDLIADAFAMAGFTFIKFNLSHNGTTVQRPTEFVNLQAYGNDKFSTDLDDIGLVINYLHSKECVFKNAMDLNKLYLVGHSRGGALTILKAAEDARIKAIATWGSIISTKHFWTPENVETVLRDGVVYVPNSRTGQQLPLYRAYYEDVLLNEERLDVKENFIKLQIPVLVAHGDADTSISVAFADKLSEWKPDVEKFIIEGANHTFGGKHPFVEEELPVHTNILVEKTVDFFGRCAL